MYTYLYNIKIPNFSCIFLNIYLNKYDSKTIYVYTNNFVNINYILNKNIKFNCLNYNFI